MMDSDTTTKIAERLEDAHDMLARGNDNYERGNEPTGYVFGILAELLEVVKAQQAEIERLKHQQ